MFVRKTLSYQFLFLSLIVFLNVLAFFFESALSGHLYSIDSLGVNQSYFSYLFQSFLILTSFYSGSWVFLPFIIFFIIHVLVFTQRNYLTDIVQLPLTAVYCGVVTYFLFPNLMGRMLFFLVDTYFKGILLLAIGVLAFALSALLLTFDLGSFVKKKIFLLRKKERENEAVINKGSEHLLEHHEKKAESKNSAVPALDFLRLDQWRKSSVEEEKKEHAKEIEKQINSSAVKEGPRPVGQDVILARPEIDQIVSCLGTGKQVSAGPKISDEYFDEIIDCLEEKFKEFRIGGKIIHVIKGPVVDTFELELGPGVKVSKVNSIAEDLSLALCGVPLRIVYPLKGRHTIGIEVPRPSREIIYLDELLQDRSFFKNSQALPLMMGKDVFGETQSFDLSAMPHMLVAGATGSGKSVFINVLLVSLLVRRPPQEMRLILIDPKQLELALYSKLPHLSLPVITTPEKAMAALLWVCDEMERRYSILKELKVRNIHGFNEKIEKLSHDDLVRITHLYSDHFQEGRKLPYITVIIDEFADLILSKFGKEIEGAVCRLAAKARACGIHLVVATQRPSVDVITGLIKSNFPTRVSFKVVSGIDSRTILSSLGAERLLGKGDMLFKQGTEVMRVHSPYVGEEEIEKLVDLISEQGNSFNPGAISFIEEVISQGGRSEIEVQVIHEKDIIEDPLLDEARRLVIENNGGSASFLQRRLRIGYNRAANLIEELEEIGIVGPQEGSKKRKVLVSQIAPPENHS